MFEWFKRWRSARPLPINATLPAHLKVGKIGENAAARFYAKNGFTILYRNIRIGKSELDIIAESKEFIVFCEVKTRVQKEEKIHFDHTRPALAVDKEKRDNLIVGARHFAQKYQKKGKSFRFDVVEVYLREDLSVLDLCHMRSAFTLDR